MIYRLLPILGVTFIDILGFSILIPLLPYFVKHFGAPDFVVGVLFSTFAFCQLLAGPVWGNVSDRIGRKAVLIISQIGATIGWTMLAFAPTIFWVFIARIVEGVSGGNLSVTQAYVADLVEPAKRARAFAYVGATFSAGIVLGPVARRLARGALRVRRAVPAAAGLQLITLLATIFFLPESRSKDDEAGTASVREILTSLRDPRLSPVMWQKLIVSLALYGWFAAFTLALQALLHLDAAQASETFALFGIGSIIMQLFVVGRLTDAFGDRAVSNAGIASLVLAFASVFFIHDYWTLLIMLLFFTFGLSANNATMPALMTDASPENQRGTILGVGASLESFSGVVMPPVSTSVLGLYGAPWTGAISALFSLGALGVGVALQRRDGSPLAAGKPLGTEPLVSDAE